MSPGSTFEVEETSNPLKVRNLRPSLCLFLSARHSHGLRAVHDMLCVCCVSLVSAVCLPTQCAVRVCRLGRTISSRTKGSPVEQSRRARCSRRKQPPPLPRPCWCCHPAARHVTSSALPTCCRR